MIVYWLQEPAFKIYQKERGIDLAVIYDGIRDVLTSIQ
jgi:hypothetical protein